MEMEAKMKMEVERYVDEGEGEDVDRVYRQLVRRSCKFF